MDDNVVHWIELVVPPDCEVRRLDVVLVEELNAEGQLPDGVVLSRARAGRLIAEGRVEVNKQVVTRAAEKIRPGDFLRLGLPQPSDSSLAADPSVVFGVVFEDSELIVIDKPPGLTVHPGAGTQESTLVNGLLAHLGTAFSHIGHEQRPGIVHRLDKDTSGLMVVAKSERAYHQISQQFLPPRSVHRHYLAYVARIPNIRSSGADETGANPDDSSLGGRINLPIGRDPNNRTRMTIRSEGRPSQTHWRLAESFTYGSVLELTLETGRTHQIRVHLKAVGAPILGDPVYGEGIGNIPGALRARVKQLKRQALHAARMSFLHPVSGKRLDFESPLPEDLRELHEALLRGP